MKGISRIDSERCVGWLVRVYHKRRTISKLFSDQKHGGKKKALALARAHHAALVKKYPPSPRAGIDAPSFRRLCSRRNTTGVNGVYRSFARIGASVYVYYGVSYKLAGKHRTRKFYVHHFRSDAQALRAAAAFRRAMEREMRHEFESG